MRVLSDKNLLERELEFALECMDVMKAGSYGQGRLFSLWKIVKND